MSVHSFNAVCDKHTHTLVLGTMPGVASLDAVEYYAHKRNAFWPIMLAFINQSPPSFELTTDKSYPVRLKQLRSSGIGLWDVLASCERKGSLDSAIKNDSIQANDFASLLTQYSQISTILFNGKTAQKLFQQHVLPMLVHQEIPFDHIRVVDLPSTSPAMASLTLQQKYVMWSECLSQT